MIAHFAVMSDVARSHNEIAIANDLLMKVQWVYVCLSNDTLQIPKQRKIMSTKSCNLLFFHLGVKIYG